MMQTVWIGVVKAYKEFIAWFGPFSQAVIGMGMLMAGVAVEPDKPSLFLCFLGGFIVFGAIENNAQKVKAKSDESWARFIWDMLKDSNEKCFVVNHNFPSTRPELDAAIAEQVANALEARGLGVNGGVEK